MTPLKIVDLGIDYFSFTMKSDNPCIKEVRAYFDRAMEAELLAGHKQREIAPSGFRGVHLGHFFYGTGKHGTLFQVTSTPAKLVASEMRKYGNTLKATRLDFQVTYKGASESESFASRLREEVKAVSSDGCGKAKTAITLYETRGSGDSVSFGSRRARRSLISYDKSAEQRGKIEPDLIRDEARFFKQQARAVWQDFCDVPESDEFIVSVVKAYWKTLGLERFYSVVAPEYRLPSSYVATDEERRVKWLLELVAPCVLSLKNPAHQMRVANAFGHKLAPNADKAAQTRALEARKVIRALDAQRKLL